MAKIQHNSFQDTINELLTEAEKRGVIQLTFEGESWNGTDMIVNGQNMLNFGTCGYLGLENHPYLIEKSIDYTRKYGTQFSVSRTYLASQQSNNLEELLSIIFQGKPVLTFTSTTMLHSAVLPCIVGNNDLVILDQQCHASIQTACQLLVAKGIAVDIVRHSNLEMLEHKIKQNRDKYTNIWYMVDGVYSMYGDVAPIEEINELMEKYSCLQLYVDDAHGMSWYGKNGAGRIFDECLLNGRTMYMSTMAKGFGVMGGIAVFTSQKWYDKVRIYGGSLTHSHPIPPPIMGACIASAELHLTDAIEKLQISLQEKTRYANKLFLETELPIISNPETPIYFVGTGQPITGYNLNKRILDDGFYVNIGMFPAVPIKNTGLRFTITNHNSLEDIKALVDSLSYHYPKALEEVGKTKNEVRKAFKLPMLSNEIVEEKEKKSFEFNITITQDIHQIDKSLWDAIYIGKGNYDYKSLVAIQEAFSGNTNTEDNWDFYYIIIQDQNQECLLATFLTCGLVKDDLLSSSSVSKEIEKTRKSDPYFMCSKTLIMGSLFTEGEHLYISPKLTKSTECVSELLKIIHDIQTKENCTNVILRDFSEKEKHLFQLFHDEGYFKVNMPNANNIVGLQKNNNIDYIDLLSPKSRKNIRYEVIKNSNNSTLEIKNTLSEQELLHFYELYCQVSNKNYDINVFKYPFKLFQKINNEENWEFGVLKDLNDKTLGVILCCCSGKTYTPILIGIDYDKNEKFKSYKTILYETVLEARRREFDKLYFGFSADYEKRKLGAKQIEKFAFITSKDLFNFELLETINNGKFS